MTKMATVSTRRLLLLLAAASVACMLMANAEEQTDGAVSSDSQRGDVELEPDYNVRRKRETRAQKIARMKQEKEARQEAGRKKKQAALDKKNERLRKKQEGKQEKQRLKQEKLDAKRNKTLAAQRKKAEKKQRKKEAAEQRRREKEEAAERKRQAMEEKRRLAEENKAKEKNETETEPSCVSPWSLASTQRCLKLSSEAKTFTEAQQDCQAQGGQLALPGDDLQNEEIKKIMTLSGLENAELWLGASDKDGTGNWRDLADQALSWENFLPYVDALKSFRVRADHFVRGHNLSPPYRVSSPAKCAELCIKNVICKSFDYVVNEVRLKAIPQLNMNNCWLNDKTDVTASSDVARIINWIDLYVKLEESKCLAMDNPGGNGGKWTGKTCSETKRYVCEK